jgi:hypothetical protein
MGKELYEGLNLKPPEEGFELYRYKNAEQMSTQGWSGLYWARINEAGDYEIRSVTRECSSKPSFGKIPPVTECTSPYEKISL